MINVFASVYNINTTQFSGDQRNGSPYNNQKASNLQLVSDFCFMAKVWLARLLFDMTCGKNNYTGGQEAAINFAQDL